MVSYVLSRFFSLRFDMSTLDASQELKSTSSSMTPSVVGEATWFCQLEAQFGPALVGLDEKTIVLVSDVLDECNCFQLKEQVIRRLSVS